jgi:uncharacterized RDD family membrane protein YckC
MQSEAVQAISPNQAQDAGVAGRPAPDLPSTPEGVARRYDSSIVVRRWGATLIDYVVLGGFIALAFLLPERLQSIAILVLILPAIAYFPVLEHLFGRTLGKTVCRVRVVNSTGGRPSWSQAILRTLLRVAEVNPVLLGGIPAGIIVLSTKARQRLGDIVAVTFVLRAEDLVYLQPMSSFQGGSPAAARRPLPPLPVSAGVRSSDWLLPTGRSGWAIAAGYLGLFSLLLVPAPFALGAGVLGLRDIRRNPRLGGRGRAIFGIVMGSLFSIALVGMLALTLTQSS